MIKEITKELVEKQMNMTLSYFPWGGNPSTIKQLLKNQKASVVAELKNHFGTDDLDKLAVCLSKGK